VIDPRYLGYRFPTYTFIETENNLEHVSNAGLNHFKQPEEALFLGTVLGEYDLVHRRVNEDRWTSAEFAKWAKNRLSYFENFETYSIFQIARWYGKDRSEPIRQESEIRTLTEAERDVIEYVQDDPSLLRPAARSGLDDSDVPTQLSDYGKEEIQRTIENLRKEDILLGSCVTFDLNNTPWKPVLMGLSLGGEGDTESPRMDLSVDHDHVVSKLQDLESEYINNFTMPFITSGIGESWADILLELRVENVHHMDMIARKVRDIDYVKSTQSYMMTDVRFNNPPGLVDGGPG
jgi:hypothetical protein